MLLYLFIFLFPVYLFLNNTRKNTYTFLVLFLCVLAIFVGISDMLGGYDRYIYAELFDDTADSITLGRSLLDSSIMGYKKEFGYVLTNIIIAYITPNRYIFILLFTLIMYYFVFVSIRDYVKNYPFACMLFLTLFFFFSFTYLRGAMAAVIAWYGYRYAIQRNLLKFFLVAFIAYSFHNSAIIFFPLYFIPMRKFRKNVIIAIMTFGLIMGLSGFPDKLFLQFGILTNSMDRVDYYAEDVKNASLRIEYFLEAIFFLFFILKNYHKIGNDKTSLLNLNAALVFCFILLFFIRSSSGGRISWPYMMGVIASLTSILSGTISRQTIGVIFVCLFLYFRILIGWGIYLTPYKTFFTDGVRKNDYIYYKYEYDENYAKNKFYRPIFR